MKPNRISPQSIAAACALPAIMAFCPTLSAQDERSGLYGSGAEQFVTFVFTEIRTDHALKPKDDEGKIIMGDLVDFNSWSTETYRGEDLIAESENEEYGTKQVTEKISNKEFIEALVEEGYIDGPISGWSVRFVTPGDVPNSSYGRFYAVKGGSEPVDLSEIISTYGDGYADTESEKWSSKTAYKYANDDYTETTRESWSFSSKWMTNLFIEFSFTHSELYLDGIFNESWSVKSFGKDEDQYWQFAPGAAKFDSGTGTLDAEEEYEGEWYEDEEPSVIKGTISFSAGKLFQDIYLPYPDFDYNYGDEDYYYE